MSPARTIASARLIIHPEDRPQVILALVGPAILLFPFLLSAPLWVEILVWINCWFLLCRHNYILHNHVHRPFTRLKLLNRVIGLCLGFTTGMTAGNWKITHIHGHHVEHSVAALRSRSYVKRLAIPDDESFSAASVARHLIRTVPIQWVLPVFILFRESLKSRSHRRVFYRFYLAEFLIVYGAVALLCWLRPAKGAAYFGIIYILVYSISRYMDYITHVSSKNASRYSFANICLNPRFNATFWNFGHHVAHHLHPKAHWSELPTLSSRLGLAEDGPPVAKSRSFLRFHAPVTYHWSRVRDGWRDPA